MVFHVKNKEHDSNESAESNEDVELQNLVVIMFGLLIRRKS